MKKLNIIKSKLVNSKDGKIIKILSKEKLNKTWKFGEIYISTFKKNVVKNWNFHKFQTSSLFALEGKIKIVVVYKKNFKVFDLNEKIPKTLIIPPKTWYAFKGLDKKNSLMNLSNKIHHPKNSIKKEIGFFKFNWNK
jgi:dTDP-4-dehydrorhamnose 3,5-epimerase-like enzyme